MVAFVMPALGADMEAGTLAIWHVAPGQAVKRGDVVATVDTDKGAIDVEVFETGTVEQLLVEPGTKVPVGTPLAVVSTEAAGAKPAAPAPPGPLPTMLPVAHAMAEPVVAPTELVAPAGHVRVSPLARRRAAELCVDVTLVRGSGPNGAIGVEDVERFAAAVAPAPALRAAAAQAPPTPPERPAVPVARAAPAAHAPPAADRAAAQREAMRRAIAAAMARSKREIPHYYLQTEIDMSRALAWLEAENAKRPLTERLLAAVLLVRAVAFAVHEVPEMNGFYADDRFRPSAAAHIGFAVSLRQGGLIAPAIHDADRLTLDELMAALRDLVARARAGGLRSSELADPTITLSNLGEQGVDSLFGIVYPPQVALVGCGTVRARPWAVDGLLGVRPIMTATLSADHRASDGHRGGRFLAAVNHLLQEPERLRAPWQPSPSPKRA